MKVCGDGSKYPVESATGSSARRRELGDRALGDVAVGRAVSIIKRGSS
jgi:hypothetical protein